jgi:hypothetical protein
LEDTLLTTADDLRHTLAPGPHARESLFYTVLLPEEGVMVCTYTWVGHDNRAGYLFVVTGDDERLAFDAADDVDVGAADFDAWQVGGLSLRHADPLRTVELTVERPDVRFSATFEGMHHAFSYMDNEDGCPAFLADDRFEQSCLVRGTLKLKGRTITIDTTGHRDHSWGTRDWDTLQDWKWISAQAGAGVGVNLLMVHARGQNTVHGYVSKQGTVGPITDARVDARFDARFRQTGADVRITDATGTETAMTIERFAFFSFEAGERILLNEAGSTGTIDGAPALVHFECGWDKHYAALQGSRAVATAVV